MLSLPDLVFVSISTIRQELKPGFPVESFSLIGGVEVELKFFLATLSHVYIVSQ